MALRDSRHRPLRVFAHEVVALREIRFDERYVPGLARVSEGDESVPAEVTGIVLRHVETVVAPDQIVTVVL